MSFSETKTVTVSSKLIVAEPLADTSGYTWTLASRLGKMLRLAQEQFGPRDMTYTILGIEFKEGGPGSWYPGNCKNIVVQLGVECLQDPTRAYYQLAHECVHLLSPTGSAKSTVLEEGLATFFAREHLRKNHKTDWSQSGRQDYDEACAWAKALLQVDPQAIKRLRDEEFVISRISKHLILKHYPDFSEEIAAELARPFGSPTAGPTI